MLRWVSCVRLFVCPNTLQAHHSSVLNEQFTAALRKSIGQPSEMDERCWLCKWQAGGRLRSTFIDRSKHQRLSYQVTFNQIVRCLLVGRNRPAVPKRERGEAERLVAKVFMRSVILSKKQRTLMAVANGKKTFLALLLSTSQEGPRQELLHSRQIE
jgi:hypothetical protein